MDVPSLASTQHLPVWPFVVAYFVLLVMGLTGALAFRKRMTKSLGGSEVSTALAGLSRQDRREVYRAVRQGRVVSDPSLAAAANLRARTVQRLVVGFQGKLSFVRVSGTVSALLLVGTLFYRTPMPIDVRVVVGFLTVYLLLWVWFIFPWVFRRTRSRAQRAEELNGPAAL